MQNRKLIQQNEYNGHPTMTDDAHACDEAVLSALESTLNQSVKKADFPRLLLLEIQMHGEGCGEINDVFRAAQAEFVKCEKRRYGKPNYEDAFWRASSISCVPLRSEPRSRVLFTSKD